MKAKKTLGLQNTRETRIWALRILVTVCLLVAAGLVGSLNYKTLSEQEKNFALSRYNVISNQISGLLLAKIKAMHQGAKVMARSYSFAHSRRRRWPKVILDGFYDVSEELQGIAFMETFAYAPVLYNLSNSQLSSFEDYMYSVFANDTNVPEGAGITPAGKGVWSYNLTRTGNSSYYHDTTGIVSYNSTWHHNVLVPIMQKTYSGELGARFLGHNIHSFALHGQPLDMMFECAERSHNNSIAVATCATLTDTVTVPYQLQPDDVVENMRTFIYQPILLTDAANIGSTTKVVGVIGGSLNWKELLSDIMPQFVLGIDSVITTSTGQFSFRFEHGEAIFTGLGDHHDADYDSHAFRFDILASQSLQSHSEYKLVFYPRGSFFNLYQSEAPLNTTIGGILIILFCACVFVVYDWAVRREFTRKEIVLDTKRRFVRFISHEMRTPLNTVHMGLKLFQMEMQHLLHEATYTSPEVAVGLLRQALGNWMTLVDDVLGNSESAVDVLNDLLNYDKIEMGTLRLEFSSVEIWSVIKKTAGAFMMQAKQMNVDLQLVGDCWSRISTGELALKDKYEQLRVVGDSTRLAQVLRNLLSNALKFTPEHGNIVMKVTVNHEGLPNAQVAIPEDYLDLMDDPRAGSVRISVTDSGAGLSESQLKQIGMEGVQFNANELQAGGGSGLGLYISKGLVQQHGGTLTVWSEGLGTGSTFTVELPLYCTSSVRMKPTPLSLPSFSASVLPYAGSPVNRQEAFSPRPYHILVVDDAPSNRKLLVRILTAKGYRCFDAEDGQKAVDAFEKLRAEGIILDAIVMDFEMPVMDGPTATKIIRDLGCTCFIAGVTGNVLPQDIDYFRSQGANRVIAKPLNIDVFESYLNSYRAIPIVESSGLAHIVSPTSGHTTQIVPFENSLSIDSLDMV